MAQIDYGDAFGDFSPIGDLVDPDFLVFATRTSTSATLLVPGGAGVELTGTGFVCVERMTINRGVDVLVDLADSGLPTDDKPSVEGSSYHFQMAVTQTARGALLDFGD